MKTELLAPAGDMDAVVQAVQNGADALYLGAKSFGARAYAKNFDADELAGAIRYAHTYGVKVYVTMNTLVFEHETEAFLAQAHDVLRAGADALIMQDVGMIAAVRRRFPDAALHASTQMHNHSDAALGFVWSLGMSRAVLAREMSAGQIAALRCPIEKEAFIHGALCICFSGQCLFSALTNGRSGNRGTCAQSCRMRYRLLDEEGLAYETNGSYLLSPKDIGLFEDIAALAGAGVGCFKIEGRMKSPEYVGLATKIYARLLAELRAGHQPAADSGDKAGLLGLFNRGYSRAHLLGIHGEELMSKDRPNHRGLPLGRVLAVANGRIRLRLTAPLNQGDGIKIERSDDGFICNKIYQNGLLVASASAGGVVELDEKAQALAGDTVVKTTDSRLIKSLQAFEPRKADVFCELTARLDQPLCLALTDGDGHTARAAGEPVQASRSAPVSHDALYSSVARLGDTPYRLRDARIDADADIFVAKSALNALRREAAETLTQMRTAAAPVRVRDSAPPAVRCAVETDGCHLHVLVRNAAQFDAVRDIVTGDIYTEDAELYERHKARCPSLRRRTDRLAQHPDACLGERLLVTDHGGLHAHASQNDIVLDHSVYAFNAEALSVFVSLGAHRVALPPELAPGQIARMLAAYVKRNGQPAPVEAVVSARHELMAMRHCVLRGALGEKGCGLCKTKRFFLEDAKGERYPLTTGAQCGTRVFHSRITQWDVRDAQKMGVRHFRVELFDETGAQSRQLVEHYLRLLTEGAVP